MKERPILMNGAMVRAVLEGRKTQTRRIVKLPKSCSWYHAAAQSNDGFFIEHGKQGYWHVEELTCPYGQPGDRLWVREAWYQRGKWCPFSGPDGVDWEDAAWRGSDEILYSATSGKPENDTKNGVWWRSRPSIHMPRWASRITLEIVSARVELLTEISEADALAEGVDGERYRGQGFDECVNLAAFCSLWESINGKGSWEANPWVWVIEFKVVQYE